MATHGEPATGSHQEGDATLLETLQSLIVAFVLAMTFRGFVTEGFVIPTGSMAPTLKGRHLLLKSQQTGAVFAAGLDSQSTRLQDAADPMIGPASMGVSRPSDGLRPRMGDRILVLKSLYPFVDPRRFDIVVFKNPTNPNGEAGNYIKRLIGLPDEKIWLADGDVFAGPAADPERLDDYTIQRKPEHVQRAVWQPVYHSDFVPVRPDDERLDTRLGIPRWQGTAWNTSGSRFRTETSDATELRWSNRQINDWTAYNMLGSRGRRSLFPIADLRVGATIVPDEPGLVTRYELEVRERLFAYTIDTTDGSATVEIRNDDGEVLEARTVDIRVPAPGKVINVEFWHVDQAMALYVAGKCVVELTYDWTPQERIERTFGMSLKRWAMRFPRRTPLEPTLRWHFEGSPTTLHSVRIDRDLYYLPAELSHATQLNPPMLGGHAAGTHPDRPAVLGSDQFFMLGDNSPASSDSRVWGNPHPAVAHQIDDAPFVVNRKLLLGKAWVVYFPAPYSVNERGRGLVPDFGRLRFIR